MSKNEQIWGELNDRQRHYLKAVYVIDQQYEADEKSAWIQGRRRRPASEWRWMEYHPTGPIYRSALQLEIGDEHIDKGTGSTFEALEERGLIECKYQPSWSGTPLLSVKLTTKGRAVARTGLNAQPQRPKGSFSRAMWRALKMAYEAGDDGLKPEGFISSRYGGIDWHYTWVHLRNYKGGELVTEKQMFKGNEGYGGKYNLVITSFGKQLYKERLEMHRNLYPDLYETE